MNQNFKSTCSLAELKTLISTSSKSPFEIRVIWLPFRMLSLLDHGEKNLHWDSILLNQVISIQYWLSLLGVLYDECCCFAAGSKRCEIDRRIFLKHRFLFRERKNLLLDALDARVSTDGESAFFVTLKDAIVYHAENREFTVNQMNGILQGKAVPTFEEEDFSVNSINRLIKKLSEWTWKPSSADWNPTNLAIGFKNELNVYEYLFKWEWLAMKLKLEALYVEFDEAGRLNCDYCTFPDSGNSCQIPVNSTIKRSDSSSIMPKITNFFSRMRLFATRSITSFPSHSAPLASQPPSKNLYWASLGCQNRHVLHLECVERSFTLRCDMCKPANFRQLNEKTCFFFSRFQQYIENSLFKLRLDKESITRTFLKIPLLVEVISKMQKWNRELFKQLERCRVIFGTLQMNSLSTSNNLAQSVLQQLFHHRISLTAGQESFFTLRNVTEQARIKMMEVFCCNKSKISHTLSSMSSDATGLGDNFTHHMMEDWISVLNNFWIELPTMCLKQFLFDVFVQVICALPALANDPTDKNIQNSLVKNVVFWSFWYAVRVCKYNRLHLLQTIREDWAFRAHFAKLTALFREMGEFYLSIATCANPEAEAVAEVKVLWNTLAETRTSEWLKNLLSQSSSQELLRFVSKIDLKNPTTANLQDLLEYFEKF